MRVLVLKDRRPGHHHQAEGLAAIIARMTDVAIERIDVRPRFLARNRVRRFALRHARDAARTLDSLYGIGLEGRPPPDVVTGSGRPTAAAGILIARATGAKFIYSGHLRDYDLADIDLVLVRSSRQAGEPHCVLAPIPTLVDPDAMRHPRALRSLANLSGAEVGLLVGGKAPGYRFAEADWRRLAELVAETGKSFGIRWSVSNSRRTPDVASRLFSDLEQQGAIAEFVDVGRAGPGSAGALFAGDAVVTTEDSLTMMAEAIAALRPVIALKPASVANTSASEEIATMAAMGGLAILPMRTTTAESFGNALTHLRAAARDPRDALAEAIAPVLGLDPKARAKPRAAEPVRG